MHCSRLHYNTCTAAFCCSKFHTPAQYSAVGWRSPHAIALLGLAGHQLRMVTLRTRLHACYVGCFHLNAAKVIGFMSAVIQDTACLRLGYTQDTSQCLNHFHHSPVGLHTQSLTFTSPQLHACIVCFHSMQKVEGDTLKYVQKSKTFSFQPPFHVPIKSLHQLKRNVFRTMRHIQLFWFRRTLW